MQLAGKAHKRGALHNLRRCGRMQVLHVLQHLDLRRCRNINVIAIAGEHFAHEFHYVFVLATVLFATKQFVRQGLLLFRRFAVRARASKAHAFHVCPLLAQQQLGRAATEEHVAVTIQEHRAAGAAVDQVHQHILRRKRLFGRKLDAARRHEFLNLARRDAAKSHVHDASPLVKRVTLQRI